MLITNLLVSPVLRYCISPLPTLWFRIQFLKQFSHSLRLVTANNAPPSTYYRSCWHVVGPGFFSKKNHILFSGTNFTAFLAFLIHRIYHSRKTLVQTFVYWPIFSTAADGRVFFSPHVTVQSFKTARVAWLTFRKVWPGTI